VVLLNQFLSQLYRQYAADEVIRLSDDLANMNPGDPDVLVLAGNWQAEYGKYDRVAELSAKALEIEPNNQNAATLLAWADFNSGHKAAALKRLDSLYKANSDNPETNMYYSRAQMASNKNMLNAGNYARMAAGSPALGMRAVANLWDYYMQQGQYNFAVGTARQATVTYSAYPLAHYLLGKSLIAYGKQEEGNAELKKAIDLGLGGEDLSDARKLLGQ
jgi:tetratricopeptide (TPR) repeat protein